MLFYNKELRLLLEICILLLKANRKTINGKELDSISKNHFNMDKVSGRLCLLDETLGLKQSLATGTVSVRENGLEFDSVTLNHPLWFYEEMVREMDYNETVLKTYRKEDRKFDEKSLYYKTAIIYKEITENKYRYMNSKIRNKLICGIGPRAIVLKENKDDKPDFHNFFNDISLSADNSTPDGLELAQEIIKEYGNKNDFHIQYALKDE